MTLRIGVVGINFKTAELALREAIAKAAQSLAEERSIFFPHPTVLLSTCNRTEVYFSALDLAQAQSDLLSLFRPFEHRLYSYFGINCFAHLCRVAAGLDSAILAETEIQRQVKRAYLHSSEILDLPSPVHFLFQKAMKVAKEVRSHFALERGAPTLFTTLWQLARQKLGNLEDKRILLVGYSAIHRELFSFLTRRGVFDIAFCTRHPERVRGKAAFGREVLEEWGDFDLISCASQADDFLIRGKGKKGHLIFDLSVPRNVDPKVGEALGVTLWNIEEIHQLIGMAQSSCFERCEAVIWKNVFRLARIYREKTEQMRILSNV